MHDALPPIPSPLDEPCPVCGAGVGESCDMDAEKES